MSAANVEIQESIRVFGKVLCLFGNPCSEYPYRVVDLSWRRGGRVQLQISNRTIRDATAGTPYGCHDRSRTLECTVAKPWTTRKLHTFLGQEPDPVIDLALELLDVFDHKLHLATLHRPEKDDE